MKDRFMAQLPIACVMGLVYAGISFFQGGVRYGEDFPPIWLQLLRNGVVFAFVYALLGAAVSFLVEKYKNRRK